MQANALRDLLGSLLAESVAAIDTEGASPAPDRQYVAHGSVTWDCELVAVNLVRVSAQLVEANLARCAVRHDARLAVTLLRCWPTADSRGTPPSADALSVAGRDLATDGQALWKGLTRAWSEGAWPVNLPCNAVTWEGLEPLAPSGGFAGWRLTLGVRL